MRKPKGKQRCVVCESIDFYYLVPLVQAPFTTNMCDYVATSRQNEAHKVRSRNVHGVPIASASGISPNETTSSPVTHRQTMRWLRHSEKHQSNATNEIHHGFVAIATSHL